jgi:hypothetical protein
MTSAQGYVKLAEEASGPISKPVDFAYIWGDALEELRRTSSRPVPLNEVCSIHLSTLLLVRLTARGYYVIADSFAVHHRLSPSPSQNRAGAINAHGSSSEPFHRVRIV